MSQRSPLDANGRLLSIRRRMVRDGKNRPCADCNQQYHHTVMEYDHLPQFKKLFELGEWKQYNRRQIREEIAKCEVVCSNCHRLRTWKRRYPEGRQDGDIFFRQPTGEIKPHLGGVFQPYLVSSRDKESYLILSQPHLPTNSSPSCQDTDKSRCGLIQPPTASEKSEAI
jgi:hypothetical protein